MIEQNLPSSLEVNTKFIKNEDKKSEQNTQLMFHRFLG